MRGASQAVEAFANARVAAGDFVSERRDVAGSGYALVLARKPMQLPDGLGGISFEELRAGDRDGSLAWLRQRLNEGNY